MFRKLSLASGLRSGSGPGKDSKQFQGKVVKYTPYSGHTLDDDDLDEVISVAAQPENVRYGSSTSGSVNGPRVVPGIITSTGSDKSHIFSAATYGAK
ncbi:hypothetical protein HDE_04310 [Halotydeus destructor]|nr:hypothetical protein HDE_04310 [Halotydeus destructor]